jgi:hypothetical protein
VIDLVYGDPQPLYKYPSNFYSFIDKQLSEKVEKYYRNRYTNYLFRLPFELMDEHINRIKENKEGKPSYLTLQFFKQPNFDEKDADQLAIEVLNYIRLFDKILFRDTKTNELHYEQKELKCPTLSWEASRDLDK